MKRMLFAVSSLLAVAAMAPAQTHYLYVAGGRVAAETDVTPGDTTATINSGLNVDLINILVADVDPVAKSVGNWRVAGVLPAAHPDGGDLHWSYLADNVNFYNDRIYVGPATFNGTGSVTANFIAYADINTDGTLGTFTASARFPAPPTNQRISATEIVEVGGQAFIYVIAGNQDETGQADRILFAPIDAVTGAIGTWNATVTANPVPDWFTGAVAHAGRLIHAGGNLRGSRSVDHAVIETAGGNEGNINTAFTNAVYDATAGNRWDYGITKTTSGGNTFMHIIAGVDGGGTLDTVHFAQLDNVTGVPGAFNTTAVLPGVRRRVTAAAVADMIVVPGGSTTTSYAAGVSTVFIGTVATDGNVTWATSPNPMSSNGTDPQPRSFHGAGIAPIPPPGSTVTDWMLSN